MVSTVGFLPRVSPTPPSSLQTERPVFSINGQIAMCSGKAGPTASPWDEAWLVLWEVGPLCQWLVGSEPVTLFCQGNTGKSAGRLLEKTFSFGRKEKPCQESCSLPIPSFHFGMLSRCVRMWHLRCSSHFAAMRHRWRETQTHQPEMGHCWATEWILKLVTHLWTSFFSF